MKPTWPSPNCTPAISRPGGGISAWSLLFWGAWVICGTLGISLYLRTQIHKLPAHKSMLNVAEIIYQTCKTYLLQQGKFLLMLFVLIAVAITYYLVGFGEADEYEFTRPDDAGTSTSTRKAEQGTPRRRAEAACNRSKGKKVTGKDAIRRQLSGDG